MSEDDNVAPAVGQIHVQLNESAGSGGSGARAGLTGGRHVFFIKKELEIDISENDRCKVLNEWTDVMTTMTAGV